MLALLVATTALQALLVAQTAVLALLVAKTALLAFPDATTSLLAWLQAVAAINGSIEGAVDLWPPQASPVLLCGTSGIQSVIMPNRQLLHVLQRWRKLTSAISPTAG